MKKIMPNRTNVGLVGCGVISRIHLQALKRIKGCSVLSVCDIDKVRAHSRAREFGVPRVYTNLEEMLENETLDVVEVLTPPQAHASHAIEVMEAGSHVLVEKPMSVTVEEADQMIEVAKKRGVKLGVVHSFLFNPAIQEALDMVESGKIGDLVRADVGVSLNPLLNEAQPKWMYTLPGGLFGEIIPHGLYVLLAFTGKVNEVRCFTSNTNSTSDLTPFSDLHALVLGDMAVGSLLISTRISSPYTVMHVRLTCSTKVLDISLPTATLVSVDTESSRGVIGRANSNLRLSYQYLTRTFALGIRAVTGKIEQHMTHRIVLERFLASVRDGSEPPVTAEEGREVVKVANIIWDQVIRH